MDSKPKFLVYDRREIWVLFLLGLFVALFAFTLGLHFGRRLQTSNLANGEAQSERSNDAPLQKEAEDKVATKDDFPIETPQGVREMSQQVVDESTAEQVEVQDLRLKDSKALELPEGTKSKNAGATTKPQAEEAKHEQAKPEQNKEDTQPTAKNTRVEYPAKHAPIPGFEKPVPHNTVIEKTDVQKASRIFMLQVGSFPDEAGAASKVAELKDTGLEALIEQATIKNVGLRYRVLVGKFPSKKSAEEAGRSYRDKKMIDQFFVSVRSSTQSNDTQE